MQIAYIIMPKNNTTRCACISNYAVLLEEVCFVISTLYCDWLTNINNFVKYTYMLVDTNTLHHTKI